MGRKRVFQIQHGCLESTLYLGHCFDSNITWSISFDVSHLDQSFGGLLNIVVTVRQNIQKQVLFYGGEHAFEIPKR